jgi:hypothetical protein
MRLGRLIDVPGVQKKEAATKNAAASEVLNELID